jgi:hypothetical protein
VKQWRAGLEIIAQNPEGKAEGGQEAYSLSVAILFTVFLSVFRAKSSLDYKNNTLLSPPPQLIHQLQRTLLQQGYRDPKNCSFKGKLTSSPGAGCPVCPHRYQEPFIRSTYCWKVEPPAWHGQNGAQQRVLQEGAEPGSSISPRWNTNMPEVIQDWKKMRLKRKQPVIISHKVRDSNIQEQIAIRSENERKHHHHRWKADWTHRDEPARWWPTTQMPGRFRYPSTWRTGHIASSNK